MGFELINRITVKKDGVYLSTHSSNDSSPYYSHRIGFLSDAYAEGGQKELDKKIFELLNTNAQLRGKHESILRYQEVWDGSEGLEIRNDCRDKIEARYLELDSEERRKLYLDNSSQGIQAFLKYKQEMQEVMFRQLAELCPPAREKKMDRMQKRK